MERTVIWHDPLSGAALILETLHLLGTEPSDEPAPADVAPAATGGEAPVVEPPPDPPEPVPAAEPAAAPDPAEAPAPVSEPAEGAAAPPPEPADEWRPSGAGGTDTGNPHVTSQVAKPSWGLTDEQIAAQQAGSPQAALPTWAGAPQGDPDPDA